MKILFVDLKNPDLSILSSFFELKTLNIIIYLYLYKKYFEIKIEIFFKIDVRFLY